MRKIPHVEDYIKENNYTEYVKKISKHTLQIEFSKIYKNEELKNLETFVLKYKQAYYNNTDLYVPYINYFIEYFDDDNELLMAYLRIRYMEARSNNIYSKKLFIDDIKAYILTPTMIEKIIKMTKYNYNLNLAPKGKFKYAAIEFDNEHGLILMEISIAIKILIPVVTHYLYTFINKKLTDQFLSEVFKEILPFFENNNNIYNKLYEFIISKINPTKKSDAGHWDKVEILGDDIDEETELILLRLLVDILYKYTFNGNFIAMNAKTVKQNIFWMLKTNFPRNLKTLSDKINVEEGLSEIDKMEMTQSKFDESIIMISEINAKQTLKTLAEKYDVEFNKDEIEFYNNNVFLQPIQKNLIFNLFGNDFGTIQNIYALGRENLSKLLIILKIKLQKHGFVYMQHILTGNLTIDTHIKKIPRVKIKKIIKSEKYKNILKKYKSASSLIVSDKIFWDTLNIILNSKITLVDYSNKDKLGKEINITDNIYPIITEYKDLIELV